MFKRVKCKLKPIMSSPFFFFFLLLKEKKQLVSSVRNLWRRWCGFTRLLGSRLCSPVMKCPLIGFQTFIWSEKIPACSSVCSVDNHPLPAPHPVVVLDEPGKDQVTAAGLSNRTALTRVCGTDGLFHQQQKRVILPT